MGRDAESTWDRSHACHTQLVYRLPSVPNVACSVCRRDRVDMEHEVEALSWELDK